MMPSSDIDSPTISVALATCDGARYLPALLDSLLAQRRPPIELVACDDASNDGTAAVLQSFAAGAPFPVRIERNPARLGVVANFSRAMTLCSGNCIALADQDDVWHADKLARFSAALSAPTVLAVFSDANVVDERLRGLGYGMWQRGRFTRDEQERMRRGRAFEVLLKHQVVTGATLAMKVGLRDTALPVPPGWPHDAWLAIHAAARDGLLPIDAPLIEYRQHAGNVVGGKKKSLLGEARAALALDRAAWYRQECARWQALAERLASSGVAESSRRALDEKLSHLTARAGLPASRWRRLPGIWRELSAGRYARHARNWGSLAIDLLVR